MSDLELFKLQAQNRSKFQQIYVDEHDRYSAKHEGEETSFRKAFLFILIAASGLGFVTATSVFADSGVAIHIRKLAMYSAPWFIISLILSYITIAAYVSYSSNAANYHSTQSATKKLADFRNEVIIFGEISSRMNIDDANREKITSYVAGMLADAELEFLAKKELAQKLSNQVSFSEKIMLLMIAISSASFLTGLAIPTVSVLIYDYI
ncbi:MAG: hypothetical protein WBG08_03410 [Litorimonas sp.]